MINYSKRSYCSMCALIRFKKCNLQGQNKDTALTLDDATQSGVQESAPPRNAQPDI